MDLEIVEMVRFLDQEIIEMVDKTFMTGRIRPGQAATGQDRSDQVRSGQIRSNQVGSFKSS